jgi:hypothetical protein
MRLSGRMSEAPACWLDAIEMAKLDPLGYATTAAAAAPVPASASSSDSMASADSEDSDPLRSVRRVATTYTAESAAVDLRRAQSQSNLNVDASDATRSGGARQLRRAASRSDESVARGGSRSMYRQTLLLARCYLAVGMYLTADRGRAAAVRVKRRQYLEAALTLFRTIGMRADAEVGDHARGA